MPTDGGYRFGAANERVVQLRGRVLRRQGNRDGPGAVVDKPDGGPTLQAIYVIPAIRQGHLSGLGPVTCRVPHFVGPTAYRPLRGMWRPYRQSSSRVRARATMAASSDWSVSTPRTASGGNVTKDSQPFS
jgi:hypothetical protein